MTGYIGCFGLLGIAVFIALLYVLRKKNENEMTEFYKENSLYASENCPPRVRESLGAANDNLYCCKANLTTAKGENVEFYWWEWYLKSTATIGGAPSASFTHYLAVSFAPNSVGDEFVRKALQSADRSGDDLAQKAKDFFVNNTDTPYRAEILADGSLIICWRTVTKRRDVYEAKIVWLKNNVSLPLASEVTAPKDFHAAAPDESEIPVTAASDESKFITSGDSEIAEPIFYTHDGYPMLRHKFNSAWTNLELELHRDWSAIFQHEGRDEFDSDAAFGDPQRANEIAFALTDETTVSEARQLFSDAYGGATYILRDGSTVKGNESLANCNN